MKRSFRTIAVRRLPAILFVTGLFCSCQQTDPLLDDTSGWMSEQTKEDVAFISSLGYDVSDIEKTDDGYLVEGDIWLTGEWLEAARQQPRTRLTRLHGGNLVERQYQNKLYLSSEKLILGSIFWENPVSTARSDWTNLSGCYVSISGSRDANSQEIQIRFENKYYFGNNTHTLMRVTPPSFDGKPGSIVLNQDCSFLPDVNDINNATAQKKATYLIMHAIGHAIGLGHTQRYNHTDIDDEEWGSIIEDTYADDASIMRREENPLPWSGFSELDKIFIPKVFPIPSFDEGSIEPMITMNQKNGAFNIQSISPATSGKGTIVYEWEWKYNGEWITLSHQREAALKNEPVPHILTSEYRRKATDGTVTGYSNTCTVTNNAYKPMEPGKIEESVLIDSPDPQGILTIASAQAALCPRDEATYGWEIKDGNTWMPVPDATGESLTTTAPMQFTTVYRRKASCNHFSAVYSNECTVYNTSFLDAGALPDVLDINKTEIYQALVITPTDGTQVPGAYYGWEISRDGHPIEFSNCNTTDNESFSYNGSTGGRLTQFRRSLTFGNKTVHTNVCTVINYAFAEDPLAGTGFDHKIDLGSYGSDFVVTQTVDTRGENFWDQDRATGGGNDAFLSLTLTRQMTVHITTGASICFVRLQIMNEEGFGYFDISSTPLSAKSPLGLTDTYPFSMLDDKNPEAETVTLDMLPGKYEIIIQGSEAYNGRYKNHVLGIRLRGEITSEPALVR